MCPADPEVRRGQEKASEKGKGVLRWEWGLVGSLSLPQGIFLTQGWNPSLMSPELAGRFFTPCATWEAQQMVRDIGEA